MFANSKKIGNEKFKTTSNGCMRRPSIVRMR